VGPHRQRRVRADLVTRSSRVTPSTTGGRARRTAAIAPRMDDRGSTGPLSITRGRSARTGPHSCDRSGDAQLPVCLACSQYRQEHPARYCHLGSSVCGVLGRSTGVGGCPAKGPPASAADTSSMSAKLSHGSIRTSWRVRRACPSASWRACPSRRAELQRLSPHRSQKGRYWPRGSTPSSMSIGSACAELVDQADSDTLGRRQLPGEPRPVAGAPGSPGRAAPFSWPAAGHRLPGPTLARTPRAGCVGDRAASPAPRRRGVPGSAHQ
jgi:hypothetical protein